MEKSKKNNVGMRKIWVAVKQSNVMGSVVASTSLAEVGRALGVSYFKLRERRRKYGEEGFMVMVPENGLQPEKWRDQTFWSWIITRVELRQVEGRGKAGNSGYKLTET